MKGCDVVVVTITQLEWQPTWDGKLHGLTKPHRKNSEEEPNIQIWPWLLSCHLSIPLRYLQISMQLWSIYSLPRSSFCKNFFFLMNFILTLIHSSNSSGFLFLLPLPVGGPGLYGMKCCRPGASLSARLALALIHMKSLGKKQAVRLL